MDASQLPLDEFLRHLERVLQQYIELCLKMVERWFDNVLYGEASRTATLVRALFSRDPLLSGHTAQVLSAHDNLVLALWRSTHVRTREARMRIQHSMDRLFAAVHQARASASTLLARA